MTYTDEEFREMAKARVAFRAHALAYVLVNAFLIILWWSNADGGRPTLDNDTDAYFWPLWSLLGWGIGLAMHAYGAYGRDMSSVDREEERLREKYGRPRA